MLAHARVGRGRGELLDLGGERRQGPERGATDRKEAGEAAQNIVVGRRRDAAARAVEAGDVQAALMHMQEAAAAIQAAAASPLTTGSDGTDKPGTRNPSDST